MRRWRLEVPADSWTVALWVMVVSQAISQIGFSLVLPFLPLYVEHIGIHNVGQAALWAGLMATLSGLAMAVMAPVWGMLADRYGRKPMVVRATLAGALIVGVMGLAHSVWLLLVLRLVQGLLTGTVSASVALVSGLVPERKLGYSMGLMQTAVFIGAAAGPLIGGIMADSLGYGWTFTLTAALLAVAGLLVIYGVKETWTRPAPRSAPGGAPRQQRLRFRSSGIAPLVVVNLLDQFANSMAAPFLPLLIAKLSGGLSSAATLTGLVLGVVAVTATLSSVVTGRLADRLGPKAIIIFCAGGAALFSLLQTFAGSVWSLTVLRGLMGLFIGGTIPSANTLLTQLTPAPQRGMAFGYASSASAVGFSVGPLVGALIANYSLHLPFTITAVLFAMEAGWVAYGLRGVVFRDIYEQPV